MSAKKLGRPTDSPKIIDIRFRFDKDTVEKLEECSQEMQITRAEVVRRGVRKMYDDLKKQEVAHCPKSKATPQTNRNHKL